MCLICERIEGIKIGENPYFVKELKTGYVVRAGVVTIDVSFSVTLKWLKKLTEYKQKEKLTVLFFAPETAEQKQTEMYVDDFKAKLEKDTSYKGLWTVGFSLKEM